MNRHLNNAEKLEQDLEKDVKSVTKLNGALKERETALQELETALKDNDIAQKTLNFAEYSALCIISKPFIAFASDRVDRNGRIEQGARLTLETVSYICRKAVESSTYLTSPETTVVEGAKGVLRGVNELLEKDNKTKSGKNKSNAGVTL